MSGLRVDVKVKYRNITEYRTTLDHKANHKLMNHNTVYQKGVDHLVLGNIGCLMAVNEIEPGEEILVNFLVQPGGSCSLV